MSIDKNINMEVAGSGNKSEVGLVDRMRRHHSLKGLTAVVLTGGMYILSFPPYNLLPLAWIALVPLLLFLVKSTWKSALLWTALMGVGMWIVMVAWLRHVSYAGWFALAVYLTLYFIGFGLIFRYLYRRLVWPATFLAPTVWLAFDLLRSWALGGFEWYYLGQTQYLNLPFIQIADVVGAMALSFFVVMVSGAIVDGVTLRRRAIKPVIACAVIIVAVFVYGVIRLSMYAPERGPTVALIQGNVPIDLKFTPDRDSVEQYVRNHAELSLRPDVREADLIIWPETMVPASLNLHVLSAEDQPSREAAEYVLFLKRLWEIVSNTAIETERHMIIGAGAHVLARNGDGKFYNSVYYVSPEGRMFDRRYDKIHLVAFGEYVPLTSIMPFLKRFRPPQMGEDLTHGEEYVIFDLPWNDKDIRFAVTICYEDTVPRVVRRFARKRPDFLVNISNDAWFKDSAELDQHMAIAVFRSVETRLPIARASNTGISSLIEPTGRIQGLIQENGRRREIEGTLVGPVKFSNLGSVYIHIGEVFPIACLIATAYLTLFVFIRTRRRAKLNAAANPAPPPSKSRKGRGAQRRKKGG